MEHMILSLKKANGDHVFKDFDFEDALTSYEEIRTLGAQPTIILSFLMRANAHQHADGFLFRWMVSPDTFVMIFKGEPEPVLNEVERIMTRLKEIPETKISEQELLDIMDAYEQPDDEQQHLSNLLGYHIQIDRSL